MNQTSTDSVVKRGFAAMDPERRRMVARLGGQTAHSMGAAHEFSSEEGRIAGRLGGMHSHQARNKN